MFRALVSLFGLVAACGLSANESAFDAPSSGREPGTGGSTIGGSNGDPGLPPEEEQEASFRAPVVTGRFIWSANPLTGRVALIDAKTRAIRTTEAGLGPTYLAALPSATGSRAIVINTLSHDASLLSASEQGEPTAIGKVPVHADANAWTISKSGAFAIAWTNAETMKDPDPTSGFQDITIVDLRSEPRATRQSVGFRPARVFINDAETHAFVVCEPGITVIDLAEAQVERDIPLSDNPARDASSLDVTVLPDGKYALVRSAETPASDAANNITLVDLEAGTRTRITMSNPVTDLGVNQDSSLAIAVVRANPNSGAGGAPGTAGAGGGDAGAGGSDAVAGASGEGGAAGSGGSDEPAGNAGLGGADGLGGTGGAGGTAALGALSSTVALLPLPGIFSAPGSFEQIEIEELFGRGVFAPNGGRAVLFSTAGSSRVTLLQTDKTAADFGQHRTVNVKGAVQTAFITPNGEHALFGFKPFGGAQNLGFAALPIARRLPARVQTTEAPVTAVALSDTRAVVTVSDETRMFATYLVRFPELTVDRVQLPSMPLEFATGIVPEANVAFVAQAHPEGRITLIDLTSGAPHTITGFELAARVQDGN